MITIALSFALAALFPQTPVETVESTQELLYDVEEQLREEHPEGLSVEQTAARLEMLDVLVDYANAGVFPHNHTAHDYVPIFIDEHGTHCAVAHLIKMSGHPELAAALASENNFLRLPSDDARVLEWAHAHGFTMDELSIIQRPGYTARQREKKKMKSPDQVARQMMMKDHALRACVDAPTRMKVNFDVESGQVANVRVTGADSSVRRCATRALKKVDAAALGSANGLQVYIKLLPRSRRA